MQDKRTVLQERLLTESQHLKLEENFFCFTFVAIHVRDDEDEQQFQKAVVSKYLEYFKLLPH
jgi:hypothetical protein